jgi:hypothetical protein
MQAAVYRLRERGVRLPRPKEPVQGNLVLGPVDRGDQLMIKAQILDDGKDLLPPLLQARVTRVTRNGMVIKGVELSSRVPRSIKAKVTSYPQTWWILVHSQDFYDHYEDLDPLEDIAHQHQNIAMVGKGPG